MRKVLLFSWILLLVGLVGGSAYSQCTALPQEFVVPDTTDPTVDHLHGWLSPANPAAILDVKWLMPPTEFPSSWNNSDKEIPSVKGVLGDWWTFSITKPFFVDGATPDEQPLGFMGYTNPIYLVAHGRANPDGTSLDKVKCSTGGVVRTDRIATGTTYSRGNIPDPTNDQSFWVCNDDKTEATNGTVTQLCTPLTGNSPPPPGQVEADCTGDQCPGTQPGSCAKFNFPNDNMPACICFPSGAAGAYKALNSKGEYQGLLFFDNSPGEHWVGYRHTSSNPSNTSFDSHFPVYAQTSDGQCSSTPLVGTHIFSNYIDYNIPNRGGINDGSFGVCAARGYTNGCYPCYNGLGGTATKTIMGKSVPHNFVNELNLIDNVYGFYPATHHPVGPSNITDLVFDGGANRSECY
jgi:hypothetical protein